MTRTARTRTAMTPSPEPTRSERNTKSHHNITHRTNRLLTFNEYGGANYRSPEYITESICLGFFFPFRLFRVLMTGSRGSDKSMLQGVQLQEIYDRVDVLQLLMVWRLPRLAKASRKFKGFTDSRQWLVNIELFDVAG